MALDPHDREDDDVRWFGLGADVLNAAHQPPPLGKFDHTSHALPLFAATA